MELNVGKKIVTLNVYDAPSLFSWGILNRTDDNYFCPFFDYDGVNVSVVKEEADFLQKNYDIGPLMLRKSSSFVSKSGVTVGSWHLVGFSKLTLPEYEDVLRHSRCDRGFKAGFKLEPERAWVLRIGKKIDLKSSRVFAPSTKFSHMFHAKTGRELSRAMFKFWRSINNTQLVVPAYRWDKSSNVNLIMYSGKEKVLKECHAIQ